MRPSYADRIDLAQIAANMFELYEAAAEESSIRLASDIRPVGGIPGDRDLIASALGGLLDNTLKYAGADNTVTVRCVPVEGGAELVVEDTGPGVPDEAIPMLTERFSRVDRSRHLPGNGIGLSNINATLKLHGGSLTVSNRHPGLEARMFFVNQAA